MIEMIDLRSDTLTKPSPEMLQAMFDAEVGDDVFGEDPTVNRLEQSLANTFGMDAGLYCASGTMANQIALKVQTNGPGEVICDETAHIYRYEGGGLSFNSGISASLIDGKRGIFTADQAKKNINPDNIHYPPTQLISVENTANRGGGAIWPLSELEDLSALCKEHQLAFHLDGARIFNALVATGQDPKHHGALFDTISVCLSKGLGAPVGSVLLGNKNTIAKARRVRKVLGGGMRQAGYLAAAGLYALENNIKRLNEDHRRAKLLGLEIEQLSFVEHVLPVETNIVVFKLENNVGVSRVIDSLTAQNILAVPFGVQSIRMVVHLDLNDDQIQATINSIRKMRF
ncbi:MAG: threonine aldolase [Bacteroidia bacterium]